MNIIGYFLKGGYGRSLMVRQELEKEGKIVRNKVGDYTIDSCYTWDCGYETAIWYKDYPMVIVERYTTEKNMKKGHKKWCKYCETKPKCVYSIQSNTMESLKRKD